MVFKMVEFRSFNPIHTVIKVPKNILLLRGYHTGYPPVSDRPAYFTSYREIVDAYANKDQHTLGYFKTTSDIKLLDLRYIKLLLRDFFDAQVSTVMTQHSNVADCILSICLALGLCSATVQMHLLQQRYSDSISDQNSDTYKGFKNIQSYFKHPNVYNPLDPQGIRIAETNNDIVMILCLRAIFGDSIDGYIMPNVYSPYHIEKSNHILNAEIVIFNPLESHIQLMKEVMPDLSQLERHSIQEMYKNEPYTLLKLSVVNMNPTTTTIKGGDIKIEPNPNAFFDIGGSPYKKVLRYTKKAMRKLFQSKRRSKVNVTMSAGGEYPNFVRNPTQKLSPFNVEELALSLDRRFNIL